MEERLVQRLLGSVAISGQVGDRINWVSRPAGKGLPALTLSIAADPRSYNHDGADDLQYTRVQFDCWGASYSQSKALARAVLSEMETAHQEIDVDFGESFLVFYKDMPMETLEGGAKVFRTTMDIRVPHKSI